MLRIIHDPRAYVAGRTRDVRFPHDAPIPPAGEDGGRAAAVQCRGGLPIAAPQEEAMSVEPNPVRASDADRERVVARLTEAVGDGTLTLAEVEERQVAAYAARFRHELAPLTADLPRPPAPVLRRRPPVRPFVPAAVVLLLALWIISPVPFFWPVFPLAFIAVRVSAASRHRRWHTGT
jgi:Domain of unknown function (DUF1707)